MNNMLIGKTLTGIKLAKDSQAILFQTTDGDIVARTDGDCCSYSWVENIENTVREYPAVILSSEDIDMPDLGGMEDNEVVQYYGLKIVTDRGHIIIDYRNNSNGYYGGNLAWPDTEYFYGGVYGQNISNQEWPE